MNAAVVVLALGLCFCVFLIFVLIVFPLASMLNPVMVLYSVIGFSLGFFILVVLLLAIRNNA